MDGHGVMQHPSGMALSGFPRIAVDPAICGDRPTIALAYAAAQADHPVVLAADADREAA